MVTASYTSFKRFIREHVPELDQKPSTTCRFETAPGDEVQIDYAKMGRLYNPLSRHNHDVFAFIATLSFCRLKFIEFVYKQDQRSFVGSHLRMFEFFGGAPKRLVIDNLKALHPDLDIARANKEARKWSREINGMREHSTTGLKPLQAFEDFDFALAPYLNKILIRELATGTFIGRGDGLILVGPPGTGKTHLAKAIGHQACRKLYSVLFYKFHDLFAELSKAHLIGTIEPLHWRINLAPDRSRVGRCRRGRWCW